MRSLRDGHGSSNRRKMDFRTIYLDLISKKPTIYFLVVLVEPVERRSGTSRRDTQLF